MPRTLEILGMLYKQRGEIVIYERFPISKKAIQVHMSWIRQALREEGAGWKIECVVGEGYKLVRVP